VAPVGLPHGFYGISDAAWGDPVSLGLRLAEAGCRVVQLRAKGWSADRVLAAGRRLIQPFQVLGVQLIINDHIPVAVSLGVGVHLGQGDADPIEARRLLPPDRLVGLSTHDLQQIINAKGADYLGFGPVFSTQSKADVLPPRGIAALRKAVAVSTRPLVAIGGIGPKNVAAVRATGVHAWTAIGATLGTNSLETAVKALRGLS
jgi:thiamine-phosphate pyrophosphorylase